MDSDESCSDRCGGWFLIQNGRCDGRLPRWQGRSNSAFSAGGLMGTTRLGNRVPTAVSTGDGFGGATGVIKTGSSFNVGLSATFSMGLSFGAGTASGTAGSDIDFNGDGYPDVVGASSI